MHIVIFMQDKQGIQLMMEKYIFGDHNSKQGNIKVLISQHQDHLYQLQGQMNMLLMQETQMYLAAQN